MPFTITRIEPQKNKKNRFSLYSNDAFIIGVTDETLLTFNIHCGIELNEKILQKIKEKEYILALKNQAFRFLARRQHSCAELYTKLIKKGFEKGQITQLIEELKNKKYLDDHEYTRLFIQDELKLKKSGPLIIRHKLLSKGIVREIINDSIQNIYTEKRQFQNCTYLAQKKYATLLNTQNVKKKELLAIYLRRKGFTWDIVKEVVLQIIEE